jgi:ABC-type uncharacterized transport system ATPase component
LSKKIKETPEIDDERIWKKYPRKHTQIISKIVSNITKQQLKEMSFDEELASFEQKEDKWKLKEKGNDYSDEDENNETDDEAQLELKFHEDFKFY